MDTKTSSRLVRSAQAARWLGPGLGLSLLVGCGTGQIGGEVSSGAEGLAGAGCEIKSAVSLSDTEQTELGLSFEDARSLLDGDYQTSLAWAEGPMPLQGVTVTPAAGSSQIRVGIEVIEGSAQLLEIGSPEVNGGLEGGAALAPAGECKDLLSVEAVVTVRADNGALDDSFEVTFVLDAKNLARAIIPLTPGELDGSFDAQPTADRPSARVTGVRLALNVTPGLVSGELTGGLEETNGQVASYMGLRFAEFPADSSCTMGVPLDAEGDLLLAARDAVRELTDFELTWTDGVQTTLNLTTDVSTGCLDTTAANTKVIVGAKTHAVSGDGAIDGNWDLEAHVSFDTDGEPSEVTLLRQAYLADIFIPGTFAEASGISKYPVDDSLSGTFSFSVTSDLTDDLPPSGELTVMEVTPADCAAEQPTELPGGGQASPGCSGSQAEEIGGGILAQASSEAR